MVVGCDREKSPERGMKGKALSGKGEIGSHDRKRGHR